MTEIIATSASWIVGFLQILSVTVLIWGVALSTIDFLRSELIHATRVEAIWHNNFIKNFLGSYILLSLEILIAADIVESIVHPTLQDIAKLAALVVIRTTISFFLHKEIESAQQFGQPEEPKKEPKSE